MLTKDDLKKIKELLGPIEDKIDSFTADVSELKIDIGELKLETKGIHLILERQEKDLGGRIEKLEEQAGINN